MQIFPTVNLRFLFHRAHTESNSFIVYRTFSCDNLLSSNFKKFSKPLCLPSPKGANVNNRWWNDRREWNLRIVDALSNRPRRGRTEARLDEVRPLWGRFLPPDTCLQVPFPSVIPPAVIESWPPSGTICYQRSRFFISSKQDV